MNENRPLLAVVPARGGSKGVPHKNVRLLGDRPLVAHTVDCLAASGVANRLIISSDGDQVLRWAELHGHETHRRPDALAGDDATISDMAAQLADELQWDGDVGVFQPTSPFRSVESVRRAVETFHSNDVDSLASCVREPHHHWFDGDRDLMTAKPLFEARVNRQWAHHPVMRETGSIQLVKASVLRATRQIVSERHMLFETPQAESMDIDTNDDLVLARRRLQRGTVVFRLRANAKVGSGHVYHCLQVADELIDQNLVFLLRDCDPFVYELVAEHGFEHKTENDLAADIADIGLGGPRLIVNDVLDTSEQEVLCQRSAGYKVVNVEDLGPGAKLADWVVNALYPISDDHGDHVVTGPKYATLRSEFLHLPPKVIREKPERILISFGGTDPGQLGLRCANLLSGVVEAKIRVVVGHSATEGFPDNVEVKSHIRSMAAEMSEADLVLTSAGRTVYEAAAVGTPVAVLAQGARDATHSHLSLEGGVVFLGIGPLVDDLHVMGVVTRLLNDYNLRQELSERLRRSIDGRGAVRIGDRIRSMLKGL